MITVKKRYIFGSFLKILDRKIVTDLHIKTTDRDRYLNYTWSQPCHSKRFIVYSQVL